MATDEEIDRFVTENRALIEKVMAAQKETIDRMVEVQREGMQTQAEIGREAAKDAYSNVAETAEFVRQKSEDFFNATCEMITNPVVQKHFMTSSVEFLAGLTTLIEVAPIPDFVKVAASEFDKNMKQTACKANDACPAKNQQKAEAETAIVEVSD
jgi:hypothetical protein